MTNNIKSDENVVKEYINSRCAGCSGLQIWSADDSGKIKYPDGHKSIETNPAEVFGIVHNINAVNLTVALSSELTEAREMVFDLFNQHCQVIEYSSTGERIIKYDHMCSGTCECAQEMLIKWGLLKQEDCVR